MRRIISATAICAMAVGLVAAPGVAAPGGAKGPKGPKGPKQVSGTVSVLVTANPAPSTATTVTASGNVSASSSCRKDRTVRFQYVNSATGAIEPLATTATTGPNGDYSAVLARPTVTPPATLPQTFVLQATVDQQIRKVGSKKKGKKRKKGRRFVCMQISGQSSPVTFSAPAP